MLKFKKRWLMKISIVNSNNKTDILNTQIKLLGQGIKQGRKQIVVVPDKFSLSMEKHIMQKLDLQASMDFSVYTFATLSQTFLSHKNLKVLSSLGATYVVQMLLNKHKSQLKCFSKTNKTINFASVIFDNISQLKSCNITPSMLKNACKNLDNPLLCSKLLDIALIYEKYEEYLGADFVDSSNKLSLLSQDLKTTSSLLNTDVHVCYFDSMTKKNLDVISSLIKSSNSLSIGIVVPSNQQQNGFLFKSNLQNDVLDVCKQLKITPNFVDATHSLGEVQNHIICNLLANKFEKLEIDNNIIFPVVCSDVSSEIRFVAMDISNKIKKGERFKDCVINCTQIEVYAPILKKIFADYKIPFWIDLPFDFSNSELCKYLNAVFSLIQNNYLQEDILKVCKNVFSGVDIAQQMIFEKYVTRFGIEHDMLWQKYKVADEDYEIYCSIVQKAFLPIKTYQKNLQLCKSVAEYVVCTQNFLKEVGCQNTLQALCEKNTIQHDLWNESINRQVFQKLESALDTLYDIMAEFQTSFEDFCSILNSGLDTLTISPLPMALDCVYVGQNLQSVFNQTPNFYVLGASDGCFPAMVGDVGIISDIDITMLAKNKINLTPTISDVNARSLANVVENLSLFTKSLHISYALQSQDGQKMPSMAFESLRQIFCVQQNELKPINMDEYLSGNKNFGCEEDRLLYIWGNQKNGLSWVIAESNDEKSTVSKKLLSTAIKVFRQSGFRDVFLSLENSGATFAHKTNLKTNLLDHKQTISVTEIERYFLCPYLHFVDYGLKLGKEEVSDIASLDNGNIIHAVLEQFVLYTKKYPPKNIEQIQKIAIKIFDNVLKAEEFERFLKSDKNKFALKKLKMECVRACEALSFQQSHSKYNIKFVEKSFGSKDFVDVPQIAVYNKVVKIKGKVDRLDEWKGTYRIIDYKTSKSASDFSLMDLYLGKKIQLFFYLYSIIEGLKQKGNHASPGGVYYLPIHRDYNTENTSVFDGFRMQGLTLAKLENILATDDTLNKESLKSQVVDLNLNASTFEGNVSAKGNKIATGVEFEGVLNYSNNIAKKAVAEIFDGMIEPKPLDGSCEFCSYRHICKISCQKTPQARTKNFKIDIKTFKDIKQ